MSVLSDQWIEQRVAKTHIPRYTNHQELTTQDETYFIYAEAGYLMGEYNHDGKPIQELIWLGDRPATLQAGDKHYFSYADHLNSPKAIIHISGQVLWRWDLGFLGVTDININHVHKDTNAKVLKIQVM
jgi:uncharacterized protein RhaS with RHS repeats